MDIKKFTAYVEEFVKLYKQGSIQIKWQKDTPGFSSSRDLGKYITKIDDSFIEEEFISVAFKIIQTSISLAFREDAKDISDDELRVIKELFLNSDLEEVIYIKSTSNMRLLENIEYEILTKRHPEKPTSILGYTAILNLITNYSYSSDDQDKSQKRTVIELTKSQITDLIHNLGTILANIEDIEKEGKR